jgi:hypothetical protein
MQPIAGHRGIMKRGLGISILLVGFWLLATMALF